MTSRVELYNWFITPLRHNLAGDRSDTNEYLPGLAVIAARRVKNGWELRTVANRTIWVVHDDRMDRYFESNHPETLAWLRKQAQGE